MLLWNIKKFTNRSRHREYFIVLYIWTCFHCLSRFVNGWFFSMEYAWRVFLFTPADNYSTFIHFMWIITIDLYRIKADKLNYHHINEVVCYQVCVQPSQTPRRWDLLGLWKVFSFHCLVTMFILCVCAMHTEASDWYWNQN